MKELRPYQVEAIENVVKDFANNRTVAIVVPTGGGKSLCMCDIANRVIQKDKDACVVVISHISILIKQTGMVFFNDYGLDSDVLKADVLPSQDANIVLTTMQSFRNFDKIMAWGGGHKVKLIIVDEAHFMGAASYTKIMSMFPSARVLAVTATPFRKNKYMTNLFDKVSFTMSTQELIDMGYLVPPKLSFFRFDLEDIGVMSSQVASIYKTKHTNKKMIVYLRSIEDCNTMRNLLVDSGIRAEAVTSKLVDKEREVVLEKFRNDTEDSASILVTVDVLTAGFDSPNVASIVIPYRVSSIVTYLQRIGRGLRPFKGKSHCDVYVGGSSPKIIDKFWEKTQKAALQLGMRKVRDETIKDRLEYLEANKEMMSKSEVVWNKHVCDLAKQIRRSGLPNIANMMTDMDFPKELLEMMVKNPPMKAKSQLPATYGQKSFLHAIGYPTDVMKDEATYLLNRFKESSGRIQSWETVPSGRFKGKLWNEVPHAYKQIIMKGQQSDVRRSYIEWSQKVKGK